jgi:ABC-2 type transport system ATP-binding protein
VVNNAVRFRIELGQGQVPPPGWVEEASVRVLKALVQAEVPVASFRSREHDLEDAFMSVTKGRVQ